MRLIDQSEPYDLGLELKRPREKGDASGFGRGAIEDAATQVRRGVVGLIDFFKDQPQLLKGDVLVVPVVFTTAEIYVSSVDLGSANLRDGSLPENSEVSQVKWLWYQSNFSSSLKHNAPKEIPEGGLRSLASVLEYHHARSTAMVSSTGIENFLRSMPDKLDAVDPLRL